MNDTPPTIFDSKGQPVITGVVLGRGGEGQVFAVEGHDDQVAKIYDKLPNHLQRNKLAAMAKLATPLLTAVAAWPLDTLHTKPDRAIVGFLMPRIDDFNALHQLYGPGERQRVFPGSDWSTLVKTAAKLARVFKVVHEHGHIVGDVNERNVLVNRDGDVRLIDADSFQVKSADEVFLCDVGVDLFTPPELQGKDVRGIQRTRNHDLFGLAVLVFQTLFMGRHPYVGRYAGDDEMTPQRAIAESRFAFSRTSGLLDMSPPPFALRLDELPPGVAMLFERSFLPRTTSGDFRPMTTQWIERLDDLSQSLAVCELEPTHLHWNGLDHCPWCRIVEEGGPNFFATHGPPPVEPLTQQQPSKDDTQEMETLFKRYKKFRPPDYPLPNFSASVAMRMVARPVPPEVQRDRTWSKRSMIGFIIASVVALAGGGGWLLQWYDYAGLVAILGLNGMVIFAAIWTVIAVNARAMHEIRQRKQTYRHKSRAINDFVHRWKSDEMSYRDAVQRWLDRAERLRDNYTAVKNTREHDEQNIEVSRRQAQLHAYLLQFPINEDIFPELRGAQLMLLRSYGLQSAADIQGDLIDALPDREQIIKQMLMQWRAKLEDEFEYDPNRPIPISDTSGANLRYAQSSHAVLSEMRLGLDELERIHREAKEHFTRQYQVADVLWHEYSQAKVDCTVKL